VKVVDGFLSPGAFQSLVSALRAPEFPWRCVPVVSEGAAAGMTPAENRQWVHGFVHWRPRSTYRSPALPLLRDVADRLGPVRLLRVKANLTLRRDRHVEYGLHVDTRHRGAVTGILYLNDNNGYTRFEDGSRVDSVANRLVFFDAARRHTGASCTDAPWRLVLNLNWLDAEGAGSLPARD